ncbi:MAG: mycofactocin-associated electron transfer flavoprotein alpha subunit [Acidimicrobiales bacterium]
MQNRTMLAIIPVRDGELPLGAEETVAEAGGAAILIGSGCAIAAQTIDPLATKVWCCEMQRFLPSVWAATLAAALSGDPDLAAPGHLLLPASPDGRDLGPHLAVALQRDYVPAAIKLTDRSAEVTRFGSRVADTLHLTAPVVASLQPGVRGVERPDTPTADAIDTERPATGSFTVLEVGAAPTAGLPTGPELLEQLPADPSTMDLAEADRIIGGGAGLGSPEAFVELRDLADRLGASTGGTRVVTDWGWLPVERQIGTTGVNVDPSLYIAIGISGAVQHTAGLGSPNHVISVNSDPHCPMMGMANLAIVCDGPEFLQALLTRLKP